MIVYTATQQIPSRKWSGTGNCDDSLNCTTMNKPLLAGTAIAAQTCLETWINCENLLAEISIRQVSYAHKLEETLDACAAICMETWQALKQQPENTRALMILCIGICAECAELCDRYEDDWFEQCAQSCRKCATQVCNTPVNNTPVLL